MKRIFHTVTLDDGTLMQFKNNVLHSTDSPAVIYSDGTEEWWLNGRRHRLDNKAIRNAYKGLNVNIVNGKVICKYRDNNDRLVFIDDGEKYIPYLTRTYEMIKNTSCDILKIDEEYEMSTEIGCTQLFWKGMLTSVEYVSGTKIYYKYGVKHNESSPAIIDNKLNSQYWYQYGMLHRDGNPAIVRTSKRLPNRFEIGYYRYGLLDNKTGPAYLEYNYVVKEYLRECWMKKGKYHRDIEYNGKNGPAMFIKTTNYFDNKLDDNFLRCWFVNDLFQRLDGPAQETATMRNYMLLDLPFSEKKYNKIISRVKLFCWNMKRPIRQRNSAMLYELSNHMKLSAKNILCMDMCKTISQFL